MSRTIVIFLAGQFLIQLSIANIPEPDTILYGDFFHSTNIPFSESQSLTFQIDSNGTTVAAEGFVHAESGSSRYVMRIPMDDGREPRVSMTLKPGDTISRVFVSIEDSGLTGTADFSANPLLIPSERGSVLEVVLAFPEQLSAGRSTSDPDGDQMPNVWEQQFSESRVNGVSGLNPHSDDGDLDNDGDGISNYEEFLTGTNPLDPNSFFGIRNIVKNQSDVRVEFGPVIRDRIYTLHAADYPDSDEWTIIESFISIEETPQSSFEHDVGSMKHQYYKVNVELE